MRFENGFDVEAPVDEVWKAVLDVERVAPLVPGAKVLEKTSDNAYKVGIKVKLGPMSMQYKADIEIAEADESEHRAIMKARAKESRGQGTADADVVMHLTEQGDRTVGAIVTDVKVSGKAASMGRGVMQDVAGRMVGTFAENLAEMLSGGGGGNGAEATEPPREGAEDPEESVAAGSGAGAGSGAAAGDEGEDNALDIGSLGGAIAAERLKDPLVIGLLILAFLLGRKTKRG
jgi:carbon monoxide dehydrogenase subunit G